MNWCEEKVGTLTYINNADDLLDFIANYLGHCIEKGIKLKIYYIDLMNNNPDDFEIKTLHPKRIVDDFIKDKPEHGYSEDVITKQALPVINATTNFTMFHPILNILRLMQTSIKSKLGKDIEINQIKHAPTIRNDYGITVETFLISIIGQLLYNNPEDLNNDTIEPLNSLGGDLGFNRNELRQFKIVLITELENYIGINKEELKIAFLQTIKEQMVTDMELEKEQTIFVAYMPIRIIKYLGSLN